MVKVTLTLTAMNSGPKLAASRSLILALELNTDVVVVAAKLVGWLVVVVEMLSASDLVSALPVSPIVAQYLTDIRAMSFCGAKAKLKVNLKNKH